MALRRHGARAVYVFGSQATSSARDDSDIDLAVQGLPPRLFFRAMADAQGLLDRPLDLIDLDERSPFVDYLLQSGGLRRVA